MRCPFCAETEDRVVDSRTSREGRAVRRRRECLACERRFTTYEYVEERPLQVLKSGGTSEPYDRAKLLRAIRLPCAKRPIRPDEIEAMVDSIEDELEASGTGQVESRRIGELVMDRLQQRDHVAYVRFASVYREFEDIDAFREELEELRARQAHEALEADQARLPL
ncbi:MAG TPA: transcriptional regulator NrdR [Longimicrobiales bacterium]|nr:transcriptional regulator NrdR [Longimicrobiales bacterium]